MKASLFKFFKSAHGKFFGFLVVALIALGVVNRLEAQEIVGGHAEGVAAFLDGLDRKVAFDELFEEFSFQQATSASDVPNIHTLDR